MCWGGEQAAEEEARRKGDEKEAELWRKRIFYYLDWLFQKDSNAGADFAGQQVLAFFTSRLLFSLSHLGAVPTSSNICCKQGVNMHMRPSRIHTIVEVWGGSEQLRWCVQMELSATSVHARGLACGSSYFRAMKA